MAARMLGVTPAEVERLVASGDLPASQTAAGPRFDPDQLDAWLTTRDSAAESALDVATGEPDAIEITPTAEHGWFTEFLCALYEVPATAIGWVSRFIADILPTSDYDD